MRGTVLGEFQRRNIGSSHRFWAEREQRCPENWKKVSVTPRKSFQCRWRCCGFFRLFSTPLKMCWSEEVWTAKRIIFSIFPQHRNELVIRVIEMLWICCAEERSAADFHPTDDEMSREERRRVWEAAGWSEHLEENQFPGNMLVCSRCSLCAGGRSPCESSDACPQPTLTPASVSQRWTFTPSMWTPSSCIRLYRQPGAGGPAPDPHLHHTPKRNLNKSNSWITIFSFSVVPGVLGMKAVENWAWLQPKYLKKKQVHEW